MDLIKEFNTCLELMNSRVTEGSVNAQLDSLYSKMKRNYSLDSEDVEKFEVLKMIPSYNVRKKILLELMNKYVK